MRAPAWQADAGYATHFGLPFPVFLAWLEHGAGRYYLRRHQQDQALELDVVTELAGRPPAPRLPPPPPGQFWHGGECDPTGEFAEDDEEAA